MPRLLIIAMHRPVRSPGQRYRFEQFVPDLIEAGWEVKWSYLLNAEDDRIFYGRGNLIAKIRIVVRSYFQRLRDAKHLDEFDAVLVYREALMTGHTFFEKRLARSRAKMILDFDDAIWLEDTSAHNQLFSFLKRPSKTAELAALADLVTVGNDFLARYALGFNQNVSVIPTVMNMEVYNLPVESYSRLPLTIGWTGSPTTIRHFKLAEPALLRIRERYGDAVRFSVAGAPEYRNDELGITGLTWSPETEVSTLRNFDIGIMPLPDDEWSRGKCACKALQYMALGIPTVLSAVGANPQVACHDESGMLVHDENELFDALCALIDSSDLRERLGRTGLEVVRTRYSRQVWKETYIGLLTDLLA